MRCSTSACALAASLRACGHWNTIDDNDALPSRLRCRILRIRGLFLFSLQLTLMISPASLRANKVQVYHTVQRPGDFIITFPQAYHAGFSHGWNMAEACNFALPDWLPFGRKAMERYRMTQTLRSPALSHEQLVANLARWCRDHPASARSCIAEEMRRVVDMEERERLALNTDGEPRLPFCVDSVPRTPCFLFSDAQTYVRACMCASPCFFRRFSPTLLLRSAVSTCILPGSQAAAPVSASRTTPTRVTNAHTAGTSATCLLSSAAAPWQPGT